MRKILFSIAAIVLVCSCGTGRRVPYVTDRDSIYVERIVERVVRDTVVEYILRDSTVSASVPASDTSRLETDVARSDAWVDESGRLNHTLRNKVRPIPVQLKVPEYIVTNNRYVMKTVVREVERELTDWQVFLITSGKIALCIFGVGIIAFVLKKYRIFGI